MFELISVKDLSELRNNEKCSIIDIRDKEDYDNGHLPGALNITDFFYYLSKSSAEDIEKIKNDFQEKLDSNGIKNTDTVVLYEEEMDKRYGGSCRGAFIMKFLGHQKVYVLHGGYSAWLNAGMEISKDETKTEKSDYKITIDKTWFVDYRETLEAINNPDIHLLDNRDRDEWIGISSSPYGVDYSPRKGRIPGAKWIEWYNFMEENHGIPMFKSDEEIKRIAEENGFSQDMHIIIYCFKGSRASNTLLALHKAGYRHLKVYFASWYEWAEISDLPVDDKVLG